MVIKEPDTTLDVTISQDVNSEESGDLAHSNVSPAVPAIDYWADDDTYQAQVRSYHEAVNAWGGLNG
jgi:hypothetical protein